MGLVRMFSYTCDASDASQHCEQDNGGEWYASEAKKNALKAGWHLNKNYAICYECWSDGSRFNEIAR